MAGKSYYPKWGRTNIEMWEEITKLELWDWLAQNPPPKSEGYMYWEHENIEKISDAVAFQHHSGCSFAMYLRNMQWWAKNYNTYLLSEQELEEKKKNLEREIVELKATQKKNLERGPMLVILDVDKLRGTPG